MSVNLDVLLTETTGDDPLAKLAMMPGKPATANENVATFRKTRKEPAEVIQRAGEDLRWYYEEREAALGFKSCGIGPTESAGTDDDDPNGINEEIILRIVKRERPIRRAVQALTWRDQRTLEAYFDYAPRWQGLPLAGLARLNEFALVVFLTQEAGAIVAGLGGHPQELRRVLAEKLADKATPEHVVSDLKIAATKLLTGACTRYLEAKLKLGVR